MKRGLIIGGAATILAYAVGYTNGMHSGALYVRDAWQRAAARSTPTEGKQ